MGTSSFVYGCGRRHSSSTLLTPSARKGQKDLSWTWTASAESKAQRSLTEQGKYAPGRCRQTDSHSFELQAQCIGIASSPPLPYLYYFICSDVKVIACGFSSGQNEGRRAKPQSIPGVWGSGGKALRGAELWKTKDPTAFQTANREKGSRNPMWALYTV